MGTVFSKKVGIHEAIKSNDYNKVKYLLDNSNVSEVINERVPCFAGKTPLMEAAIQGNFDIVKLLIEKGASVNLKYAGGERTVYGSLKTALDFAIEKQHWTIAQIIFTELLIYYAQDIDCLTDIINKGIRHLLNINRPSIRDGDTNGYTILTLASKNGHIHIVELLIENHEVDIHIAVDTKKAWEFAANAGHWDIVRILFEAHSARCLQSGDDINVYLDEITKLSQLLLSSLDPLAKLKLSIIREIDYTVQSSLGSSAPSAAAVSDEPEDRILLQISTSTPSHFIFKLVRSRTTKKWHIAFSDITEEDIEVSNIYFRRIVEVGIIDYNDYFREIINVIREQETIDALPELLLGIENIEHLQVSSYEEVSYLTLVRRDEHSVAERLKRLEHWQAKIIHNFTALKKFVEDNKQRVDITLGNVSSGLDDVRTDVEELATEVKELQTGLDYLRVIIGIRASKYESDPYKHTLYLSLRWYLSSSYAAALVVSSSEEIVAFGKTGTTGKIGGMLEAVSPHVPMGGSIVVQFFASILKSIDERYQKNMIENYAKIAPGTMGMEVLSHEIATKIIDVIAALDIAKIESSTNSIARKCIDMMTNAVTWSSSNSDQIETAIHKPLQAIEESVMVLIANEVQESIVGVFTKQVEELSNAEQRGQKHALVIATLLISKIYTLKIENQNLIYNMEAIKALIDGEIVSSYKVLDTSAASAAHPTIAQSQPVTSSTSATSSSSKKKKCIICSVTQIEYQNLIINKEELLNEAFKVGGSETTSKLIDLGEDVQLAEAIIEATEYYGAKYVIDMIFLANEKSITFTSYRPEVIITNNQENFVQEIDPITEQNFFLNNAKGIQFIQAVANHFDESTLFMILELGKDYDIAEQILAEADLQGIDRVVYRLLGKEIPEVGSTYNLENIISTDELNKLQLVPNGILNSWTNKAYLKIVEHIDYLAKNLDNMLNVGKSANQIAIIITLLEEWLNFAASGQRLVSMPYFYHGDYDEDYPYAGRGGSDSENYANSTQFNERHGVTSLILPLYNETYNSIDYQM